MITLIAPVLGVLPIADVSEGSSSGRQDAARLRLGRPRRSGADTGTALNHQVVGDRPASSRPLIGDNVYSALRPKPDSRGRPAFRAFGIRRRHPLDTVHAVEDLVERVLGTSPLPRDDNDVTLLLVGLRQQLPHLEQLLGDTAPDLVSQARRIRDEPVPDGRMPMVILTIRLAEIAQALVGALLRNALPRGTATGDLLPSDGHTVAGRRNGAESELTKTEPMPLPELARTSAPGPARAPSQHRSSRAAELVSAAAGSLGVCGPPAHRPSGGTGTPPTVDTHA
ncbi:hypothetical protein [Streptomyces mutabilis]|uniref:hypothetical protein n=1 Tax=Streptomyces mutabilis TaxID=67332 RepID=UPI00114760EB|nr:hypothetical protein [Streptomyces mutabilis]